MSFLDLSGFPYFLLARLTQNGTAAPVMTTGVNNIPQGLGVWTRTSTGLYVYTLAAAFPLAKTYCFTSNGEDGGAGPGTSTFGEVVSVSTIQVQTEDLAGSADSVLQNASFLLLVRQ